MDTSCRLISHRVGGGGCVCVSTGSQEALPRWEKKKQGLGVGEGERTRREKTPFPECATITVKSNKAEIRFAYLSSTCDYTSFCLQPQELTEPQRNTDAPNEEKMAFMQISPHLEKLQPNASAAFRGFLK